MKTPEEIAEKMVAGWQKDLLAVMITRRVPNGPTFATEIAAAIAAERAKADALAEALRVILDDADDITSTNAHVRLTAGITARAALAAYESDA